MKEKFSLKDHLFNEKKVSFLATSIKKVFTTFEEAEFVQDSVEKFPVLELKERIVHISLILERYLPKDYKTAVQILLQSLPEPLDNKLTDNDFGDYIFAPYHEFIARNGCTSEHLDFSLKALKECTKRFSVEYAIRKFINTFPKETFKYLTEWSNNTNYHVRRLCSEGTRPTLPWAIKINTPIVEGLNILDRLYFDSTRYVTRSVANHLNDISKIDPDLVISTLKKWKNSNLQTDNEMDYITQHALRTLVKAGHQPTLEFLGFGNSSVEISDIQFLQTVWIGEAQTFSFQIQSKENQKVIIDYIVYFQNKQGKMLSKKVHKLQTIDLIDETPIFIQKRHIFRADMSTRTLYEGLHQIDIQINGTIVFSFSFELIKK